MATNPTSKNASFTFLEATSAAVALTGRQARFIIKYKTPPGGPVAPLSSDTNLGAGAEGLDAIFHPPGQDLNLRYLVATRTSLAVPETGSLGAGIFIFRDNQDGGGLGTSRVVFLSLVTEQSFNFPVTASAFINQSAALLTLPGTHFAQPGTYKIVPVLWSLTGAVNDTSPPTTARVRNDVNLHNDFYIDSDNNVAFSNGAGDAPALTTFVVGRVGWIRVAADAQTLTSSVAANQRYGHQPTVSVDVTAGTLNNPKQLRLGIDVATDPASSAPTKSAVVTPAAAGTATGAAYNVDTLFPATATAHRLRAYVGPTGGQASTPAGETPDLLSAGTLVIPNTNDTAWVVFGTPAAGLSALDAYTLERTTDINVGSGISLFKDAALTQPGVGVFRTSAYTTPQNIFRRQRPSVTTDAIPFLEAYVSDAYGAVIPSTSFIWTVRRQTDDGAVNTQTISTDASGRVRWNFTIATTAAAFNRYVKSGTARQTGSHVATGPDNPLAPPATFLLGNSDHPADYPGPYPAYPRRVRATGNAFAGVNEPSDTEDSVFGINSEILFEDIWTGVSTAVDLDVNGVPTGAGQREQQLGAGSLKAKLTTLINEGNVRVINLGEHNPKDVAGRNIVVTVDSLFLRRALFNNTEGVVIDGGSSLNDAQTKLENSIGYNANPNSVDSISPPADPAALSYYQGAADTTTQRATFSLTAVGSVPDAGFTADVGNFGYLAQLMGFIAIDTSSKIVLHSEVVQSDAGLSRRFTIKLFRITADDQFVDLNPDAAPLYVVYSQSTAAGTPMTQIVSGTATPIGALPTPNWEFFVTMPTSGVRGIRVFTVAKVNGSRVIGGSEVSVQIGYEFDALGTFVGIHRM